MQSVSSSWSATELGFARDGILVDCRADGRQRLDVRRVLVRTGTIAYALGSATAVIGASGDGGRSGDATVVSAAVSCDVKEVAAGEAAAGELAFTVDVAHKGTDGLPEGATAPVSCLTAPSQQRAAYEAQLRSDLSRCYGGGGGGGASTGLDADTAAATRAVPVDNNAAADKSPRSLMHRFRLRAAAASTAETSGFDLAQLAIGTTHAFVLQVDVQVRSAAAGNVLAVACAAVREALSDSTLPTATVAAGAEGQSAVHVNYKQRTRRVDARGAPVVVSVAIDDVNGLYVADPSPLEAAALPFSGVVVVCPAKTAAVDSSSDHAAEAATHHHTVLWTSLHGSRPALQSSTEDSAGIESATGALGAGLPASDLAALLNEVSGALADNVLHSVDVEQGAASTA